MYCGNALAATKLKLRGLVPEDNDELNVEFKREDRLRQRYDFARSMGMRPTLNTFAASRFVKNALFDPTQQKDWGNVEEKSKDINVDVEMESNTESK